MKAPGSNPFTSQAKRTGSCAGSKRVMGPAPDVPAMSALHVVSVSVPNGVTSPRPVTATRRRTWLLPHLVVEVLHRIADRAELLRLFVGDVDVEFLLERHDQLDGVEAVGAQILHEARVRGELVALHAELLDDDVLDLLLELLHVHCHGVSSAEVRGRRSEERRVGKECRSRGTPRYE